MTEEQQPPVQSVKLCMGCGRQIPLEYHACPFCGKTDPNVPPANQGQGSRLCIGCGRQIPNQYFACPYCGTKTSDQKRDDSLFEFKIKI